MKTRRVLTLTAAVAAAVALSGCSSSDSTNDTPDLANGDAEEVLTPQAVTEAYNAVVQDLERTAGGAFPDPIVGDYDGAMVVALTAGGNAVADLAVAMNWDPADPDAPAFDGTASNFLIYRSGGVTEVNGELTVDQALANAFNAAENESIFIMTGALTPEGAAQNDFQAEFAGSFYDGTAAHAGQVNMFNVTGGGSSNFGSGNFYVLATD